MAATGAWAAKESAAGGNDEQNGLTDANCPSTLRGGGGQAARSKALDGYFGDRYQSRSTPQVSHRTAWPRAWQLLPRLSAITKHPPKSAVLGMQWWHWCLQAPPTSDTMGL